MQRNAIRYALLGFAIVALAAGVVSAQDATAALTGRVIDAATSQPIAGATVRLRPLGKTTRSGRDGSYSIAGVAPGTYFVLCSAPGYRPSTVSGVTMAAGAVASHECRLTREPRPRKPSKPERKDAEVSMLAPMAAPAPAEQSVGALGGSGRMMAKKRASMATGYGVGAGGPVMIARPMPAPAPEHNREGYDTRDENPFVSPATEALSTFSIDVDTASYSNVRRFIEGQGQLPPRDAVKIEELVNYFTYDYPAPAGDAPFAVTTEISTAPWNDGHRLVRIGLQGKKLPVADLPPSNLVFLLDVSGSMASPDKLPLLKSALSLLVNHMRAQDRVAITVYAGAAGLVLPSTPGTQKETILAALERLEAGGSTAGAAGIELAYQVARQSFIHGGNNRVILATDGDFNVGVSSDAELVRLIEEKRKQGVFLTVLGFGTGNYQDAKMEKLADKGNGNHAYIDSIQEAKKVLVSEMGGTLFTIAKDVKLQIEFNPTKVKAYRLLGYENRMLAAQDFNDDKKDAGELGAGHSVTAFYEIIPAGSSEAVPGVDELKYQKAQITTAAASSELMTLKLRYKRPDGNKSQLITHAVEDRPVALGRASTDFRFATAVAELGLLLRNSEHKGNASYASVIARAEASLGKDSQGYRRGFVALARRAAALAGAR